VSTRAPLFNHPLLLGFEQFERTLDRLSKSTSDAYPPYNIEQKGEDGLRITLAVAGFAGEDLSVQTEGNQLVIRGKQSDEEDRVFLHRGIAARQFQRVFVLADGIEVTGALLDNGLLHVDLMRPTATTRVKNIPITGGADAKRPPKLKSIDAA
jgi:HSP20 family molecular chaperone IbpA